MNANEGLINAIFEARRVMQDVSFELEAVSDLLYAVGLDRLAGRIAEQIGPLCECSQTLVAAHGDSQSADLRHSQHIAGNLLLLALRNATGGAA